MKAVATTRQIERYDIVELLEPVDAAPAGARGGVLEFLGDDRSIAEIEILEPKLDGLDNIVYARLDKLRVVEPHQPSGGGSAEPS
jgi:hypothetical protein